MTSEHDMMVCAECGEVCERWEMTQRRTLKGTPRACRTDDAEPDEWQTGCPNCGEYGNMTEHHDDDGDC